MIPRKEVIMGEIAEPRQRLLASTGIAGATLFWATSALGAAAAAEKDKKRGEEKEVGAVEDLMREHGVLRRALLVYIESVPKLRDNPGSLPADGITRTAKLFRSFGEDYHERMLEESSIFPTVKKAGGAAAAYIEVLKAQHDRGREITDYILTVTSKRRSEPATLNPLPAPSRASF
jgi:iron-sulfur cluster repair protein YtfE (RIC family)